MSIDYDEFMGTIAYGSIVDLSATTVALLLSAIDRVQYKYHWSRGGLQLSAAEWDEVSDIIGLAIGEIMSSLVGLIFPHIMATASAFKFLPCDGQTYFKSDYPLLYDVLAPVYIISGTQFRVPDYRDRVLVGTGNNYALDDSGGVDSVTLTTNQIPSHSHGYQQPTFGVDIESVGVPDPTGVGNPPVSLQTNSVGGGESHENRQPYRAVNWVVLAG